jgi:hypothetical protein
MAKSPCEKHFQQTLHVRPLSDRRKSPVRTSSRAVYRRPISFPPLSGGRQCHIGKAEARKWSPHRLRSISAASLIPSDKTALHGDILGGSLGGERDGVIGECLKRRQTNERRGRKAEIRQRPEMPKLRSNNIPTIWTSFQVWRLRRTRVVRESTSAAGKRERRMVPFM